MRKAWHTVDGALGDVHSVYIERVWLPASLLAICACSAQMQRFVAVAGALEPHILRGRAATGRTGAPFCCALSVRAKNQTRYESKMSTVYRVVYASRVL